MASGPRSRLSPTRLAEAAVLGLGLLVASFIIFVAPIAPDGGPLGKAYVFFPLLMWAAIRFGQRESKIHEGRIEDKVLSFVEIERIEGMDVRVAYDGTVTSATEIHFTRTPEGLPA